MKRLLVLLALLTFSFLNSIIIELDNETLIWGDYYGIRGNNIYVMQEVMFKINDDVIKSITKDGYNIEFSSLRYVNGDNELSEYLISSASEINEVNLQKKSNLFFKLKNVDNKNNLSTIYLKRRTLYGELLKIDDEFVYLKNFKNDLLVIKKKFVTKIIIDNEQLNNWNSFENEKQESDFTFKNRYVISRPYELEKIKKHKANLSEVKQEKYIIQLNAGMLLSQNVKIGDEKYKLNNIFALEGRMGIRRDNINFGLGTFIPFKKNLGVADNDVVRDSIDVSYLPLYAFGSLRFISKDYFNSNILVQLGISLQHDFNPLESDSSLFYGFGASTIFWDHFNLEVFYRTLGGTVYVEGTALVEVPDEDHPGETMWVEEDITKPKDSSISTFSIMIGYTF